ncbi:MAG: FG-GAP-like repeat-containing protein [Candidatus Hydrogenedentota bacterium]
MNTDTAGSAPNKAYNGMQDWYSGFNEFDTEGIARMRAAYCGVLMTTGLWGFAAQALEAKWTFDPPLGDVDCSPGVADLNGDGKSDLVVTTTAGMTIAVDSAGRQMWMSGVQIPISIPPTVVDLLEDPTPEVLVLNQAGRMYCLSGKTGDTIWQFDFPGKVVWGTTSIAAFDLDGDGVLEIVAGDDQGHVVCLSNEGELRWQYNGEHGYAYCPAIGAIGENESSAVLIGGSKIPLVCLNADGTEWWRAAKPGNGTSPVIADLDGDGRNEIVSAIDNAVAVVDGMGKVRWTYATTKAIDGSIAVADANEDGVPEIYAIDLSGVMVSLTPDGGKRWTANVHERVRRSPAIADVDGDGKIDIVAAGYSGEMYVFSADGELQETIPMTGATNASPTVADLDGNGTPYIIYAGSTSKVFAYAWPDAKPDARIAWPEYRFSSARQAAYGDALSRSPVTIASIDFGKMYIGPNTFSVTVSNPKQEALHVGVTVSQNGEAARPRTYASSEETFDYEFDYSLSSGAPIALTIECRVYSGDALVAQRNTEAYVVPFRKEVQDLREYLGRIEEQARRLPNAFALLGEAGELRTRLAGYAERALTAGTLTDVERRDLRDALRADLDRFERLGTLSSAAMKQHDAGAWPLQASWANPWAPFGGMDEVIEGRTGSDAFTLSAFAGEVESAALNIINWDSVSHTVRVEVDPLVHEGSDPGNPRGKITLLEVADVPTQMLDTSFDALPRMNSGNVLTIPGLDARQIWFSVDTKGMGRGVSFTYVKLRTLEPEPKTLYAVLSVNVWPTPLADTNVLRQCNWAYVHNSRLKDYEAEAIADMTAHGTNVFATSFAPRATFDESGNLVGEIDFADHDNFVRLYAPHGMLLFQQLGALTGPGGMDGEAYKKAYIPWMRDWVAHLKEMGVGYDGFAMYPVDEPGLNEGLVDLYLNNAKLTREADPKVLMYTDPVGRITAEELQSMVPYVDIWCPNRNGFLLNTGAEKLKIMQDSGAQMWTYECDGNAKHQSPLGYYRAQAWLAWHHGLTGIGFWSYCTSSADPWYRSAESPDYLMVYQGDGVVSSKRWEAVRDGVEDYAMLHALRDAAARQRGAHPEAAREAERLLGGGAAAIAQFCGLDADGTLPGKGGAPGERAVADRRYKAIQGVRAEIARLMAELGK